MDYRQAIAAIAQAGSHIGTELTPPQARNRLSGDALRAARSNNPLNDRIVQYRAIGPYTVELALVDFNGFRDCGYSCGLTVWRDDICESDLSECIDIDAIRAKLELLA